MSLTNNTPSKDSSIEACVERICAKGCKEVRLKILAMENGDIPSEAENLTSHQFQQALEELKTIMAVYGSECRI